MGLGTRREEIAWVFWETICKSKNERGLGVKDLRMFNIALLAKWFCRLGREDKGLWIDIIKSKYGSWRELFDSKRNNMNLYGGKTLRKYLIPKLGDRGSRIIFYEE